MAAVASMASMGAWVGRRGVARGVATVSAIAMALRAASWSRRGRRACTWVATVHVVGCIRRWWRVSIAVLLMLRVWLRIA